MSEPLLSLENASIMRAGRAVVEGASLSLRCGDIIIVRGANGSGKSTLLAALAGLAPLASGAIARRAPIALLAHANGLNPALTINEHLRLWRALYPFTDDAARAALGALLLAAHADRRAGSLSAGQARRAAFARLLVSGADILLLDEPTAGMDAQSAAVAARLVEDHARAGGGAIIATHEPFAAFGARTMTLGAP